MKIPPPVRIPLDQLRADMAGCVAIAIDNAVAPPLPPPPRAYKTKPYRTGLAFTGHRRVVFAALLTGEKLMGANAIERRQIAGTISGLRPVLEQRGVTIHFHRRVGYGLDAEGLALLRAELLRG